MLFFVVEVMTSIDEVSPLGSFRRVAAVVVGRVQMDCYSWVTCSHNCLLAGTKLTPAGPFSYPPRFVQSCYIERYFIAARVYFPAPTYCFSGGADIHPDTCVRMY